MCTKYHCNCPCVSPVWLCLIYLFIYCNYLPMVSPNSLNCFPLMPCIHFRLLHICTIFNTIQYSQIARTRRMFKLVHIQYRTNKNYYYYNYKRTASCKLMRTVAYICATKMIKCFTFCGFEGNTGTFPMPCSC